MASGILGFRADVTLVLGDDPWLAQINWRWDRVTVFILFNGFFDFGRVRNVSWFLAFVASWDFSLAFLIASKSFLTSFMLSLA